MRSTATPLPSPTSTVGTRTAIRKFVNGDICEEERGVLDLRISDGIGRGVVTLPGPLATLQVPAVTARALALPAAVRSAAWE